ncbi:MAG: cbb3-type cytochrome c oxidase N-terminal domain-containing protein [Bacteroidota bacterium]
MKNRNNNLRQKIVISLFLLASAIPAMALGEEIYREPESLWSNPVFLILTLIAIALTFVIYLVGKLLTTLLSNKVKSSSTKSALPVTLIAILMANNVSASTVSGASFFNTETMVFYLLSLLIVAELIIIMLLAYGVLRVITGDKKEEVKVVKKSFLEKFNASVEIENEKDIMLDHDYDGIHELDNDLPPWWKYGFYLTIVFGIFYLVHYHITGSGKLQLAEYEEQIQTAAIEVELYKKKAANLVDENNVTVLSNAKETSAGKELYTTNCAACHGMAGEGGVGPNLTDAYWLHGGSINSVFKSIKYGWPQKGMKAWEKDFGARQIQEISSFIISIQGSNPLNAKEKQGELYQDTTLSVKDSIPQVDVRPITAL